jgi:phage baseplate assembly protein W
MINTSVYYLDISKLGKDLVGKKDASILINQQAVVESVLNIISTEPGERVMAPTYGCSLQSFLFQPIDIITAIGIRKAIEDALTIYEPRLSSLTVEVKPYEDENTYIINVIFSVNLMGNQQSLTFNLNKVR